ncbi:MAG: hypothetical protein Q4C06_08600 [Bacillota bacterium]|nr:hypothetical protein [Bacillota bacterium]
MEQMKNAEKLEFLLDTYGNSLFRLSLMMLQNEADAEDAYGKEEL